MLMAGPEVSLRGCLWHQQLKDSRSLDLFPCIHSTFALGFRQAFFFSEGIGKNRQSRAMA